MTTPQNDIPVYIPRENKIERRISVTDLHALPTIVQKAKLAQKEWSQLSFKHKAKFLQKIMREIEANSDYYAEKIAKYNGKLKHEALVAEIFPTLSCLQFFSSKKTYQTLTPKSIFLRTIPWAKSEVRYSPQGVIGIISPWNYPFMLSLQNIPAALMAGNSVILKPSEFSAAIGEIIDELFHKAGLPQNLVQVIYGYGQLGQALIESDIQKISFTGSTQTGKLVAQAAAKNLKPYTLELGGKDAAIVLDDATVDKTVEGITWAAFTNCGQTCASIELAYLPNTKKDAYLNAFKRYLDSLPDKNFGRMNTLIQSQIVKEHLEDALKKGAKILQQKQIKSSDKENNFIQEPTILTDVPKHCKLRNEETFGPLLPLIFYDDIEEVLTELDQSPYGLTTSIWTNSTNKAEKIINRIDSGTITINDHMITPGLPEAPWMGHKMSGQGFSHSIESLKDFSKSKYVYSDRGLLSFKFWQYPFGDKKQQWILRFQKALFSSSLFQKTYHSTTTLPQLIFSKNK